MQPLNTFVGSIVEDRYRIEEELGAGAMGAVYRGRHIKVGRTVAIKVLHDHLVQDDSMVARFEREAKIAARLKHENLVGVIDIGTTTDGKRLMVLEFAPGRPMADLVTAPMHRDRVIALTRQLLLGLEHAHAAGLIHRDLKPENVLVESCADGTEIPRIVDFGIAVLRDSGDDSQTEGRRLTATGVVLGTPMYMSPEQAKGEVVDERTDLFALGVMVYEMLAGTTPFEGSGVEVMMLNICQDPPSIATRTGRHVDAHLEAFARKLMAREASDRFASATEALAALDAIAADAVPVPVIDPPTTRERAARIAMEPLQPPPRRRRWGTLLGAVVAALAGLTVTRC
jgi:serine/threonine protein kinase